MATGKFDNLLRARDRDDTANRESRRERPRAPGTGKRRDGAYKQVSAYIRKETHHQVKIALLEEEREFSELVEELLSGWLEART